MHPSSQPLPGWRLRAWQQIPIPQIPRKVKLQEPSLHPPCCVAVASDPTHDRFRLGNRFALNPAFQPGTGYELAYLLSRFEIEVACSTPSFSQVPRQMTRSPSLTWLASMLFTFLLWC